MQASDSVSQMGAAHMQMMGGAAAAQNMNMNNNNLSMASRRRGEE